MPRPDFAFRRLWLIDEASLSGIRLILIDMDNTLVPWHTEDLDPRTVHWIRCAEDRGMKCVIATNANPERAERMSLLLGIPSVSMAGKPFPFKLKGFMRKEGFEPSQTALIGDQWFTDGPAASGLGCRWILTDPLSPREMGWTHVVRRLEILLGRKIEWE